MFTNNKHIWSAVVDALQSYIICLHVKVNCVCEARAVGYTVRRLGRGVIGDRGDSSSMMT